jgi:membrane protease YdiL (CAAX protease family)
MPVNPRKILYFLGLTFAISWTTGLALYVSGAALDAISSTILVVAFYMWAPAIAALIVQRRTGDVPVREALGLVPGRLRWSAAAWLAPLALLGLTLAVGLALPEVSFTTDYRAFLVDLGLPADQIEASMDLLERLPVSPIVLFVGQGLVAGLTINAVAALGEELGWRGFLLAELAPLGFWRLSAATGLVWGVWHAPIVLQGHNFPEAPGVGAAVMVLWTLAASPIFTYLTLRARSVLAPTVFHGSFNAVGFLSVVYLEGAGNLWIAPVGMAGIGAALLGVLACVIHDRSIARAPVITSEPLTPWVPRDRQDAAPNGAA